MPLHGQDVTHGQFLGRLQQVSFFFNWLVYQG